MDAFIELKNVVKSYTMGDVTIYANNGVNFKVNKGEFTVIVGASGAGKTTILNMLGGMDTPTSGTIVVDGHNIATYDDKQLTDYRRDDIGFVFQFYNLVQNLTALENVELASQISKDPLNSVDILERVGLGDRKDNFPAQLSGGEQQRVAIARAIAKNPKLLLCDEPTGALDYRTSQDILQLICDINERFGNTIIMVTHNESIKYIANHIFVLYDGRIKEDYINTDRKRVNEVDW